MDPIKYTKLFYAAEDVTSRKGAKKILKKVKKLERKALEQDEWWKTL